MALIKIIDDEEIYNEKQNNLNLKIITTLKENPNLSVRELADKIGTSKSTIQTRRKMLEDAGLVVPKKNHLIKKENTSKTTYHSLTYTNKEIHKMNNVTQSASTKFNSKYHIGITLFNFISNYYSQVSNGLQKYINCSEWKIKYTENFKDVKIILCMIDEISIKYSSCIDELNKMVKSNQVVIFVNIRRYPNEQLAEDSKQIDLQSYLKERKLEFNWRIINSFIPDENIPLLDSYIEVQDHITQKWNVATIYDPILNVFKNWCIAIFETDNEFRSMPKMMSFNEIEEYISISLGDINNNVSTLLERMMKDHTQKTEELIETTVGRILKEKFESISEKLQKKYETDSDSNTSIHTKLQYILKSIDDHKLTMYPIFSVPGLGLDEVKLKDIIENDNILYITTSALESFDQYMVENYSEEDILYIEKMYTFINFLINNLTQPASLFFDKSDPYIKHLWDSLDYPYTIFMSRIKASLDRYEIVTIQDLFQRYQYLDVYDFTPHPKWFGCVKDILLSLGFILHSRKIVFLK